MNTPGQADVDEAPHECERQLVWEVSALNRLQELNARLMVARDLSSVLTETLHAAGALLGSDFGSVHLYDAETSSLTLVAHCGFKPEAVDHFRTVMLEHGSLCALALQRGGRIVIEDVLADPRCAPDHAIARIAGWRGVQSTPLLSRSGKLIGMLSNHFRRPHRPPERELRLLDLYVRQATDLIERMQAEEALRESEQRFAALFNQAAGGIACVDLTGRFTMVNDRYCRIVGRSREQLLRMRMQDITHPDDLPHNMDLFRSGVEEGRTYTLDKRYLHPDGSIVWVSIDVSAIRNASGNPVAILGICQDVTERRRVEQLLAEQTRLLELIATGRPLEECLNALSAAVMRLDPNARAGVLMADEARAKFERAFAEHIPPSFGQGLRGAPINELAIGTCGTALYTGEPVSCSDIAGSEHWSQQWRDLCVAHGILACHSTPVFREDGTAIASFFLCFGEAREPNEWEYRLAAFGAHVASIAIERDRSARALRESEERYRKVVSALPAAIYTTDAQGRITLYNDAAVELWGREPEIGKDEWCGSWTIFRPDGSPLPLDECPMAVALQEGRAVPAEEIVIERPDGSRRDVAAYPDTMFDTSGRLVGAINMLVDITERRRTEAALRESEERFRGLFESVPVAVFVCDRSAVIQHYNRRAAQFWGREPKCGDPAERYCGSLKLYLPDGTLLPRSQSPMVEVLREGTHIQNVEVFIERPDGSRIPVIVNFAPLKDARGEVVGVITSFDDITERKRAEEAVRQRTAQFETLFNDVPLGVYLVDSDLRIREVNPTARPVFGDIPDLIGRDFDEVIHVLWPQAYADEIVERFRHTLQTGEPYFTPERVEERLDRGVTEIYEWRIDRIPLPEGRYGVVCYFNDISSHVQAREALRESEERFRALITASSDVVYRMSPDWSEMRHLEGREFIADTHEPSRTWLEKYIHPDDQRHVMEVIHEAIRTRSIFELEHRVLRVDGTLGWTFSRAIPLLDADGEIVEWFGAASDVTERKRAEEAVRESERRLRFVMDSMPQKIFTARPDGNVDYFNPIWTEFTGLSFEQIRDWGWTQFVHPEDVEENVRVWRRSIDTGEPFQFEQRFRRADGEYCWHLSRAVAMRDEAGRIIEWIGSNTDIHDLKTAEEDLARLTAVSERQRRLYDTILTSTPDLVYVFDLDHRFTYANQALLTMWGRTWDEAIGKNCLELGYPDWHAATHGREIEQVKATKQPVRGEVPFTGTHGRRIYDYIFVPVIGADGEVEAVAGTTRDVTERKQTEEQLRDADRRKDEFLATLAHELRNPLAPISNAVDLMRLVGRDAARVEELRGTMERQVKQMVRLIDDLLDVSRISRGKINLKKQRVELWSVVASAVEAARPVIEEAGHELSLDETGEMLPIEADPARLAQVVTNLLNNAAKYTPRGGHIWLKTERDANEAMIRVRDNGSGIPIDRLADIFEMFSQIDRSLESGQSGLGIGLTLVKSLVELHGGHIAAHSDGPGTGSEFGVRLPLLSVEQTRSAAVSAPPVWQSRNDGRFRVLVVEDSKPVADIFAMMLGEMGHRVEVASNGEAALEELRDFRPDVVFSDISMPQMNGYELARRLREQTELSDVFLVAMTGYGQPEDRERALQAGFDRHIIKPAAMEDLQSLFEALATRAQSG